jgi:hypothetical protein
LAVENRISPVPAKREPNVNHEVLDSRLAGTTS